MEKVFLQNKRLLSRGALLLSRMVRHQSCILHQLCTGWKEEMGFWRYLDNEKVSIAALKSHHIAESLRDTKLEGRHVLSIQDSSTVSFKNYQGRKIGVKKVGSTGENVGFIVHPNFVLDAQTGHVLGMSALSIHDEFARCGSENEAKNVSDSEKTVVKPDLTREVWEKKTARWLHSARESRATLSAADTITHIADRECDFYEMLLEFGANRAENEHLLIRVRENRWLGHMEPRGKGKNKADETVQSGGQNIKFPYKSKLYGLIEQLPVAYRFVLNLPSTHKRKARKANMELRFAQKIPICRPKNGYLRTFDGKELPLHTYINVVDMVEILPKNAPPSMKPLRWTIYTTHEVQTVEQALQIVSWYYWRWKIELLFAVVKSNGLDFERALVEKVEKLKKLSIFVIMAAILTVALVQVRDGKSEQPITDYFDQESVDLLQKISQKLEGNTEKQKNPHPPKSLAFAAWVIARLGGWKGYATHRPPGIKTMNNGIKRFYDIKNAKQFFV